MRFYKEFWGFIFEFNSIKQFVYFTLGRICGLLIFVLLIVGWYILLYLMGYIKSIDPLLGIIHIFI